MTIVHPSFVVDVAASKAATEKIHKHSEAGKNFGHRFLPFAMEVYGHMHSSCAEVFQVLSYELEPATRTQFAREARNAVAAALARGRVKTVVSAIAIQKASWSALSVLRK